MLTAQAASTVHTYSFVLRMRHARRMPACPALGRRPRGKRAHALPRHAPVPLDHVPALSHRTRAALQGSR